MAAPRLTRREWLQAVAAFILLAGAGGCEEAVPLTDVTRTEANPVKLPEPRLDSQFSLEKAIQQRRSVRGYAEAPVSLADLGQLLWAAQGITSPLGLRAAPSAGATYPLEVYVVAGEVTGLAAGIYRYGLKNHELTLVQEGDQRRALAAAALGQSMIEDAPLTLVMTAVYRRTEVRYGERTERYVHMEVGHAAQNVYLQATALGLGTVVVGAFSDDTVAGVLGHPKDEAPLYIMPVGKLV